MHQTPVPPSRQLRVHAVASKLKRDKWEEDSSRMHEERVSDEAPADGEPKTV